MHILTKKLALELDANALTAIGHHCQLAASYLGANSTEGKPFADLEAAIWQMLDLITEASAAQEAR